MIFGEDLPGMYSGMYSGIDYGEVADAASIEASKQRVPSIPIKTRELLGRPVSTEEYRTQILMYLMHNDITVQQLLGILGIDMNTLRERCGL